MRENHQVQVVEEQGADFSKMLAKREEVAAAANRQTQVDISRAIREVEAALTVAKARPRDEVEAYKNVMLACKRLSFAERAIYSYKRGKELVEGSSIKLAETIARCYGNLDYGWREVDRTVNKSILEAYCWDLETNTKKKMLFEVSHYRDTRDGRKLLESERDIYEHLANMASRRVRTCILSLIPPDLESDAKAACKAAMVAGMAGQNKIDYARKMVTAFEELGVSHDQLKKYLGVEKVVGAHENQLVELRKIYAAIKDGVSSVKEFFGKDVVVEKHSVNPEPSESASDDLLKRLETVES